MQTPNTNDACKAFGLKRPSDDDKSMGAVLYRALTDIDILTRKLAVAKGQIKKLQAFKESVQVRQVPFGFRK
jgi:hypothetical protein